MVSAAPDSRHLQPLPSLAAGGSPKPKPEHPISFPEDSCWLYSAYKLNGDLQHSFYLLLAYIRGHFLFTPLP